MEFEKENTLNMSLRRDREGINHSFQELQLGDKVQSGFSSSKSSHFSSYATSSSSSSLSRQNHTNSNNNNNSNHNHNHYRKRNPPAQERKGSFQKSHYIPHQSKGMSRSSSFHDEICAESKSIEKTSSSELFASAGGSGNSTESALSSGASTPTSVPHQTNFQGSMQAPSNQSMPHIPAYRCSTNPSYARQNYNHSDTVYNPYTFLLQDRDIEISQQMMAERNAMYHSVKPDPEVLYVITQLCYQAKDYLYQQHENLARFYEDKRVHELKKLDLNKTEQACSAAVGNVAMGESWK